MVFGFQGFGLAGCWGQKAGLVSGVSGVGDP